MRRRHLPACLLALVVLAALVPAAGAHGGWRSYIVSVHDAETANGTVAWFNVDNRTEANPTVPVHRNETVVFHVVNLGSRNHTLELGPPLDASIGPIEPKNESSASFAIPADAPPEIPYRDPAWAHRGARGVLSVPDADTTEQTPGVGPAVLVLCLATLAALAARARRS